MTELEQAQALEAAKTRVATDMPYVHVGEARLYHYHADTKRWYVEVDVTHMDEEQGAAMVLCRVSSTAEGLFEASRITLVEVKTASSDQESSARARSRLS